MTGTTAARIACLVLLGLLAWRLVKLSEGPEETVQATPPARDLPKATDAQIAEALKPIEARWAATDRDVVRVTLEPAQEDTPWISKVGGAPYLESRATMPVSEDGKPMVLLAQVNFAELPAVDGYPKHGLLQFFVAVDIDRYPYGMDNEDSSVEGLMQQRGFRVRFVAEPKTDTDALVIVEPSAASLGLTPHEATKPLQMKFEKSRERITPLDVDFQERTGIEPHQWAEATAERLGVDLYDFAERALPSGSGHKIGGYPFFTQYDPRPASSPLRLLLQLDSDEYLMWGDVGVGAFFIEPDDLARADFSRVLYHWDNH